MTREQFVDQYLKDSDLYPIPCDCGEVSCSGWQMASRSEYEEWEAKVPVGAPVHESEVTQDKIAAVRAVVISLFAAMDDVGAEIHPFALDDARRLVSLLGIPADKIPSDP